MTILPDPKSPMRIGTRGSPLALAQAHETRDRLTRAFSLSPDAFEIVVIRTTGDRITDRPLGDLGGKGLFTKEIEEALIEGDIDIAVHSMKDMPVDQPAELCIDCFLPREDPRDAFLSPGGGTLGALAKGARVGTSSLRRRAQLLHRRPDLQVVEFRGNVQTRLKKLAEGVASATFLATAGLNRLGLDGIPATPIDPAEMLPAVAQGTIGIERRRDDSRSEEMLLAIHHRPTGRQLAAERAFLAALDGSCQTPIAGLAEIEGDQLTLRGEILSLDGSRAFSGRRTGPVSEGARLGYDLAHALLSEAGPGLFDRKK